MLDFILRALRRPKTITWTEVESVYECFTCKTRHEDSQRHVECGRAGHNITATHKVKVYEEADDE